MKKLCGYFIKGMIIIFICSNNLLFASNDIFTCGARSAGMAGSSVALADFWSLQNNQAGFAGLTNITAGVYYENRFLVKELGFKSIGLVVPTGSGNFGLSLNHFGYTNYSESKIGLAYSKSFGKNFSAGIQLDYLNTIISGENGNKNVFTFEAGILASPVENLNIGVHIFNPIRAKLSEYNDERILLVLRTGISYCFSEKIIASIEAEKNSCFPLSVKTGIEYGFGEKFFLRAGIGTQHSLFAMGFGYYLKKIKLDIATGYHQTLGFTPQISFLYEF